MRISGMGPMEDTGLLVDMIRVEVSVSRVERRCDWDMGMDTVVVVGMGMATAVKMDILHVLSAMTARCGRARRLRIFHATRTRRGTQVSLGKTNHAAFRISLRCGRTTMLGLRVEDHRGRRCPTRSTRYHTRGVLNPLAPRRRVLARSLLNRGLRGQGDSRFPANVSSEGSRTQFSGHHSSEFEQKYRSRR